MTLQVVALVGELPEQQIFPENTINFGQGRRAFIKTSVPVEGGDAGVCMAASTKGRTVRSTWFLPIHVVVLNKIAGHPFLSFFGLQTAVVSLNTSILVNHVGINRIDASGCDEIRLSSDWRREDNLEDPLVALADHDTSRLMKVGLVRVCNTMRMKGAHCSTSE